MTEQTNVEKINAFMANQFLGARDASLKELIIETNRELQEARQQLDQLSEQLKAKQVSVIQLGSKLDGFLDLVVKNASLEG